jgi:hypothetical protein
MTRQLLIAITSLALASGAWAQDRPSEDELFGAPPAPPKQGAPAQEPAAPPASPSAPGTHADTEDQLFGAKAPAGAPQAPTGSASGSLITGQKEDWLKIGGQLQLRAQASAYQQTAPRDWPFSSPNLLDVYLDTRPNDRVRGFVLGRLSYDPTVRTSRGGAATPGSGSQGGTSSIGFGSSSTTDNPGGVLDQLWLNFDVSHRAFVTAGRQHVKWGVGRFWNPTDFLHPVKRDPLATFDVRTGTTMLKVHVPWEKRGWNFYGMAVFEDLAGDTTRTASRLGRIGGGGRAELVLGSAELGLDAVAQDGHHPRYGVDLSAGVGDFDLYTEAAFRSGGDGPRWRQTGAVVPLPPPAPPTELQGWQQRDEHQLTPQVVVGGTWAFKYSDEDSLTVGAEYFYNSLGYDRRKVYPFLLLGAPALGASGTLVQQDPAAFQSFYLGKHYAAVNLYLPRPGRWNDTTVILTVLGNLSDRSYVARLDTSVLVLTYMTVETFVAGHFGQKGGEFRLALPSALAAQAASTSGESSFPRGAPIVDVGISLRVAL